MRRDTTRILRSNCWLELRVGSRLFQGRRSPRTDAFFFYQRILQNSAIVCMYKLRETSTMHVLTENIREPVVAVEWMSSGVHVTRRAANRPRPIQRCFSCSITYLYTYTHIYIVSYACYLLAARHTRVSNSKNEEINLMADHADFHWIFTRDTCTIPYKIHTISTTRLDVVDCPIAHLLVLSLSIRILYE